MSELAAVSTATLASPRRWAASRASIPRAALPLISGGVAASALILFYVGLISWAQGFAHARDLLWGDRYFVAAFALGLGTQVALFTYVNLTAARARLAPAGGVTAAGAGTSTTAMAACCAHHVSEALPLIGLSSAAVFVIDYRLPIMATGLAMNAAGVTVMGTIALRHRRAARACREAAP